MADAVAAETPPNRDAPNPNSALPPGTRRSRSLRLRLALWYGTLLALALLANAALILLLTTNALGQGIAAAVQAEGRVALHDVQGELQSTPPYWPTTFTLANINAYSDPGGVVEMRDLAGATRYRTAGAAALPLPAAALAAVRVGGTSEYIARDQGERVQIEAQPIRAPTAAGAPTGAPPGAVIGVLLVGKSLRDVDNTLGLLRTLLLITGALTLGGALAGGWVIASRVLRPLAEIGAAARAIAATTAEGTRLGNLSMRVRRPPGEDEMAQVVDTLNGMLAALESATMAQRRFVADASHELRAPLTTVQGNLAILQRYLDELPSDERRTMLADAHAETLRLARLVDDLLLLARADAQSAADGTAAGNPPGAPAAPVQPPVELDRALLQLVRQLRRRLAAEGAAVTLEIGHVEPARVRGDEETLRRIALILLDNAIKYTLPGAGPVTVSLERDGGQAVLRVRDRGIGIDAADLPHIFERFYRADRARDRQGTGLGLAIAQALAEQVGARLIATSTPGAGSTFSLYLPLA